jgi:hypothetical protein
MPQGGKTAAIDRLGASGYNGLDFGVECGTGGHRNDA